jgi:hypothetical protein
MFPTLLKITINEVVTLNTWLVSAADCDSNLWTGLVSTEQLCVDNSS